MGRRSITVHLPMWIALATCGPVVRAQRLHVHTYSEADGLGSTTVRGISQDADGLMWFATRAGITSYDGLRFRNYLVKDGLPQADHGALTFDSNGTLWAVSTVTPIRAAYFDGTRWHAIPRVSGQQPNQPIHGFVHRSSTDDLVVATRAGEVFLFDGTAWRTVLAGSSVLLPTDLDDTPYGLLMSTQRGLVEVDPYAADTPIRLSPLLPFKPVWGVAPTADGDELWIVGPGWIALTDDGVADVVLSGADTACSAEVGGFNIVADGVGGVMFGNPSCLYRFSFADGLQELDLASGMATASATAMFRDREGHLWVSSDRGLSKIVDWHFISFDARHGLYADEVTAVLQRAAGNLVLGSAGGLTLVNGSTPLRVHLADHPQFGRVLDLAEGPDGRLWAAVHQSGLASIDDTGRVTWDDDPGLCGTQVNAVLFDTDGAMWVSTDYALYRRAAGATFELAPTPGYAGDRIPGIRRLHLTRGGALYGASATQGLWRFDPDRTWQWRAENPQANNVFAVCATRAGRVLAGTVVGVYEVVDDTLLPAEDLASIDRPVYFITEDDMGRLWIGTDFGVYRQDGTSIAHFGIRDGLIGTETNRATGVFDDQGHLWIGTDRGATVYRPEFDHYRPHNPEVQFLELEAGGTRRPWRDDITLAHDENSVVFAFRVMAFGDERRVRVRSWLEGIDETWGAYEESPTRELRHTHLPPGRYRLHLQALAVDGLTSAPITSPWFSVRPPLWAHPGFVAGGLVVAAVLFYLLVAAGLNQRYARRLREEVRVRTAELRESEAKRQLMEQEQAKSERLEALGILAGGIAHDFNNLLTIMMGNLSAVEEQRILDDEARGSVTAALQATERARGLTHQLLTFAKGGAPVRTTASIAEIVRENVEFSLRGSNLRCTFDLPVDLWFVDIDVSQISQVLNNLLINARQAMPDGGTVALRARNVADAPTVLPAGRYVLVEVEDHGTGIDVADIDRVFDPYYSTKEHGTGLGLAIAFSIIEKHMGRLMVHSVRGQGSTFSMYLPASGLAPRPPAPDAPVGQAEAQGRILVMDDDEAVRHVMLLSLRRIGYEVDGARCGQEALMRYRDALAAGMPYDVVILDLTVRGGMGGLEAVRELHGIDPAVRAIAASGYSEDTVMANAHAFGFAGQIAKPFRPPELAHEVRRVMAGRAPALIDDDEDGDALAVDHR